MAALVHPQETLKLLVRNSSSSFAALSRMVGRPDWWLARYVREGMPAELPPFERGRLARFFGVEEYELGGPRAPGAATRPLERGRQPASQKQKGRPVGRPSEFVDWGC
jgi:hypothetical protein